MKTFFAIAFAGIAAALELEETYLAQVAVAVGDIPGVTAPADTPLDLVNSTKSQGKVSYQVFFDKAVTGDSNDAYLKTDDTLNCSAAFDADIHMCCFRFDVYQPFLATTTTERWGMTVQHNCKPFVKADYNINFQGFEFAVNGNGASTDHTYSIAHSDNAGTFARTDNLVTFQLNNIDTSEDGFKHFSFFWGINTFADDNATTPWSYTYSLLDAVAASKA